MQFDFDVIITIIKHIQYNKYNLFLIKPIISYAFTDR